MIQFFHPVIAQYLDPGAGSYIFQLVIAGLTAFLFFFSFKLKGFFSRFRKNKKEDDGAK